MLKHLTAYPITETNAHTLSILSGQEPKTLKAVIGWYAAYSETTYPRWQLFPKSMLAKTSVPYDVDEESYP